MSLPPKNSAKQREHDRARILTLLLADDALTESLLDPQGEQDAALRDQTSELTRLVNSLPAADIADALESLPPDERHVLWQQVDADKHGQILVEASETVWDSLISGMSDKELLHALSTLDIDDQIYLGQHLPRNLMGRLLTSMAPVDRDKVREVIRYGKHTVGAMMDFELITVRPDVTLATVQRYLRLRGQIPENTDKLFVTDRRNRLQGELPLTAVLLHKPETLVSNAMEKDPVTFDPEDNDEAAARTFERDDLVSAAVVDARGKLMGRLTVAEVVEKGGRPISKADFLSMLPFSTTLKWPNKQGEEDVVLHPDGRISGKGYHYSSRSESPIEGRWQAEEDGKVCTPKTFTAWNRSTSLCWYGFVLGETLYQSNTNEPSSKVISTALPARPAAPPKP